MCLALMILICVTVTDSLSATYTAATCSYSDVSSALSASSPRDTVVVPAGSCTWNKGLSISKGINLIGSGMGKTIIMSTQVPVINYAPSSNLLVYNYPFRISGFTFDLGGSGQGLNLNCDAVTTLQTKIRIDNNRFYNSAYTGGAIENWGCRGVIDNNDFDTFRYPLRIGWGDGTNGEFWWNNHPKLNYGTAENIYVEDNTFTGVTTTWEDADTGGRFAFRYNTVTVNGDMYPLLDVHGPGSGGGRSAFGAEVYGNQINASSYDIRLMDQRGGKVLLFNNNATTSSSSYENQIGVYSCEVYSGEYVNDSYWWNNRKNLTGSVTGINILGPYCGKTITENVDFWHDAGSFDGTSGVGCGTLASRPSTCTTGVGYWATEQSCKNLEGMVGVNPSTPVSGTLYKCTEPNTWTSYFSPYTYPHPLTTNKDTFAPMAPSNLR